MVRNRIKFKPFKLGKEKKKEVTKSNNWWVEDISINLDDFESNYFINREVRRVR